MSIQSISQQIQDSEQYKIRKQTVEQAEQAEQAQQTEQAAQVQVQTDEYDKANPVGETVEGIYSVSHDDEGNLKVNYTRPADKNLKTEATEEKGEASGGAGAGASTATSSTDDDDELEELEKKEEQLKAQLNRETDENVKQSLRQQLQSVQVQIALKNASVNS